MERRKGKREGERDGGRGRERQSVRSERRKGRKREGIFYLRDRRRSKILIPASSRVRAGDPATNYRRLQLESACVSARVCVVLGFCRMLPPPRTLWRTFLYIYIYICIYIHINVYMYVYRYMYIYIYIHIYTYIYMHTYVSIN